MALAIYTTTCIVIFFRLSLWSLTLCGAAPGDVACLKSIKDSFEDPHRRLASSWNFNNKSKDFICSFAGVDCWNFDENRVLNIRLSDMGLRGQFPRGIVNCTTVTGFNFSGNQLSGAIPSDLSQILPFVSTLDLSHNNLSGEIPPDIANCSFLNVLKLDNNQLTGQIPPGLGQLSRLRSFSVSNNLLFGPVPVFINAVVTADSYAYNPGLCGAPLDPCLPTTSTSNSNSKAHFGIGFLLGYVLSFALVLLLVIKFCMAKPPKYEKVTEKQSDKGRTPTTAPTGRSSEVTVSTLERLVTRMGFEGLREATSNFCKDNVIGFGEMGTMYKATLGNGWSLAVKMLNHPKKFKRQFTSELMTVGRLRHKNLVPLLGFCVEGQQKLLVYKYMPNKSLYDWLHNYKHVHGTNYSQIIDWPSRVKIMVGLARGLAWLHHRCNIHVAHLNLSSRCILLDHKLEPKISNFGEALILNPKDIQSKTTRGDFVMTSELWEVGFLKKDVYDLGMLLLEMIISKDPDEVEKSLDGIIHRRTNGWTNNNISCKSTDTSSSWLSDAIDKDIVGQGYEEEIFRVVGIARSCIQQKVELRPSMVQVYGELLGNVGEKHGLQYDSDG